MKYDLKVSVRLRSNNEILNTVVIKCTDIDYLKEIAIFENLNGKNKYTYYTYEISKIGE